jgi:hypothetical protein
VPPGVKASIEQALATGAPARCSVECRLKSTTSVGGYVWVDCAFSFAGTRFYAVFRDVSAAKKAEVRSAGRRCGAQCVN